MISEAFWRMGFAVFLRVLDLKHYNHVVFCTGCSHREFLKTVSASGQYGELT